MTKEQREFYGKPYFERLRIQRKYVRDNGFKPFILRDIYYAVKYAIWHPILLFFNK